EVNRMSVLPLPVLGDPRRHAAQNMRRQVLDSYPRQNQESRVVSEEVDVATTRFGAPAEVAVATAQVARRTMPSRPPAALAPIPGTSGVLPPAARSRDNDALPPSC